MENAKDTFYVTLRNRLSAVNPQRTMLLRSIQRPGILVEESEVVATQLPPDVFVLKWTGLKADCELPAILTQLTCEIAYASGGTQENVGLDRGRALEEMDSELIAMMAPCSAQKMDYTKAPPAQMQTMVFWTMPQFGETQLMKDRIARTATATVFAFQEQGEL
jgi:hypothetical protein